MKSETFAQQRARHKHNQAIFDAVKRLRNGEPTDIIWKMGQKPTHFLPFKPEYYNDFGWFAIFKCKSKIRIDQITGKDTSFAKCCGYHFGPENLIGFIKNETSYPIETRLCYYLREAIEDHFNHIDSDWKSKL